MSEQPADGEVFRCSHCGQKNFYYRQSDGVYVCKTCGNEWKKLEEEVEE